MGQVFSAFETSGGKTALDNSIWSRSVVSDSFWPHGLLPTRLLICPWDFPDEYWSGLPFPSPGGSSRPRDRTRVSCTVGRRFTVWATKEVPGVKRREAKSKGEKERYSHLNAEFQRIARREKKAFLSDQCKEIEENSTMGKASDLFKKIRDTKGTFHAKMGSIKDRNGRDLTEAEDIKKKWQEYTEELCKKDLHDPDNHNAVITHLELDILECEVKWALGSITTNKASGGDGIPVELFQILKDDAVKVLHSICQQI